MPEEISQSKFEGYAIVEIMGHQRVAGYVTTEAFGSVVMFRVVQQEEPAQEKTLEKDEYLDGHMLYAGSKVSISRERAETFVGASSVYRMTPCTAEQATKSQPLNIVVIEKAERKVLAGIATPFDDSDLDEDGDDQEKY